MAAFETSLRAVSIDLLPEEFEWLAIDCRLNDENNLCGLLSEKQRTRRFEFQSFESI